MFYLGQLGRIVQNHLAQPFALLVKYSRYTGSGKLDVLARNG